VADWPTADPDDVRIGLGNGDGADRVALFWFDPGPGRCVVIGIFAPPKARPAGQHRVRVAGIEDERRDPVRLTVISRIEDAGVNAIGGLATDSRSQSGIVVYE
jgi:hypothetical protein